MEYIKVLKPIIKEAGTLLENEFAKETCVIERKKSNYDIQAQADLILEAFIIKKLKEYFPEYAILAEESGDTRAEGNSEYKWVLDPIDGTINFSQGIAEFCISLALVHKTEIIFGLIYQPVLKEFYWAEKNKGSFLNGKPISVSKQSAVKDSFGSTDCSSKIPARLKSLKALERLHKDIKGFRIFGSTALNLARVACGRMDFHFNNRLNFWDVAAGIILIQEAGGRVTDFQGENIGKDSPHYIASNRALHEKLLPYM